MTEWVEFEWVEFVIVPTLLRPLFRVLIMIQCNHCAALHFKNMH